MSENLDKWKCLRCDEEFEHSGGVRPTVCPNPNCGRKGAFEALTGPFRFFEAGKFVPRLLGDGIMKNIHFATMEDTDEIYAFNGKVYVPNGEVSIKREAQNRLGKLVRTNMVNETIDYIRRATFTPRERFDNNNPHQVVAVENGLLEVKTQKLHDHTPDKLVTIYLPVRYDTNADCQNIKKFLTEIMDKKSVLVVTEFVGYCLLRSYQLHKALMLVGDGSNGKSTFLTLLTGFLGRENVSSPSLQDIIYNRFATADLYGKLANVHADIPNTALKITGKFKMLTGGDMMYAEKKHRAAFKFVNYAKLLFSANEIPQTQDKTGAFYRRWIVVAFPNKFEDANCDPAILDKLITPEELSGFLNLALEGLHRLLAQHKFSYDKSPQEVSELYERMSDPIKAFVDDMLENHPENHAPKDRIYQAYREYMLKRGVPIKENNIFSRMLKSRVPIEDFYPKIEERQVHCWKGIRLKVTPPVENMQDIQDKPYIIEKYDENLNTICYKKEPAQPEYLEEKPKIEKVSEPTAEDIVGVIASFAESTVAKAKIAEKAGVSLERLDVVLGELKNRKKVIDRGAFVEVVK